MTKGLSAVTTRLRAEGKPVSREVNHLVTENLFITITNANFDREAIIKAIETTLKVKAECLAALTSRENLPEAALYSDGRDGFDEKAKKVGVLATTTARRQSS